MLTLAFTLITALVAVSLATPDRKPNRKPVTTTAARAQAPQPDPPRCEGSNRAISYYRQAVRNTLGEIRQVSLPARRWWGCNSARRRALEWREKARAAREQLAAYVERMYDWTAWMPRGSKWYRVASCETGYGGDPNWQHDSGTYVSAFGIYRQGYADDAHRIGNMSWDETIRARGTVPTPREQYEAALSHYREHGGFSGWGCRGA